MQRNKQLRSTKRFSANMFVEVAVKLDSLHFPECQVPTRKTTLTKKTALAHAQETRSEPKPQTPMHSTQGRGVDISAEERNRREPQFLFIEREIQFHQHSESQFLSLKRRTLLQTNTQRHVVKF